MASTGDIELQRDTLGRGRGGGQSAAIKNDENEAAGYGDTSTKIWKLYGTEAERHDKELVDSWKSNTDSMLIFTGLFSSIVASFLIETYKTLIPAPGSTSQSAPPSAVRINIILFLSLFFSVISALASTLIQQWAREYLQYSQPNAAPHKRGRVRAYLFDGLSKFQMRRLTYGVPVLLHLAVFLFFYALSEWLHSINVPVGTTARYCLVSLFAVYMALSVLPIIVRNAPYQTAMTTPLRACVSLIRLSYIVLRRFAQRSSTVYQAHQRSDSFKSIHVDRARALIREVKKSKRASELDRSAMHWLLQELDEDNMDTFLSGLPGYLHSPLTDKKVVVEGLLEDGVPGRIREHITTCLRSVELSQDDSMSRASTCISSLLLISEAASETAVSRPSSEGDDIQEVMEYIEPLCYNPSTALRASCIRGLVIREFLIPLVDLDARKSQIEFPDYLIPLHKLISVWKTTEIAQWPHITGSLITTPILTDSKEMWQDVYDGPLINLAVLAYAVLSRADEGEVDFEMAWKTLETLLKSLGLAQVRASPLARARFEEVLLKTRDGVSGYERGVTQIGLLLKMLDIVVSGLRLAEAFTYTPRPMVPQKQIEALFGPEQLRNTELLEAFSSHLPGYIDASTPEESQRFMERLILEDKLWEQIHYSFVKCFKPEVLFPDKVRIIMAFFEIFEVAFDVLKESTTIEWRAPELDLLFAHLAEFDNVTLGESIDKDIIFRSILFRGQFCHGLLSQFAKRHSQGEPLMMDFSISLERLVGLLGVGTQEDLDSLIPGNPGAPRTGFDMMMKAGAILNLTLCDGALLNFCILGRRSFEMLASDVSDMIPDDIARMWKLLGRILYTPPAPFTNSSVAAWSRFDHLCDVVRDPAFLRGNSQAADRLRPLVDMIEEIERIRPPPDEHAEGTGNVDDLTRPDGSAGPETLQPGGPPFPGSSSQAGAFHMEREGPVATPIPPFPGSIPLAGISPPRGWSSDFYDDPTGLVEPDTRQLGGAPIPELRRQVDPWHPGVVGLGGPMDTRFSPSIQPSIRTAGMNPLASRGRSPSDLNPVAPGASPTYSIPTTQTGPHVPRMHPLAFPPTYMPSLNGARRAFSLDTANHPVQARAQTVLTDIPIPPTHQFANPYPSPYSSSSPAPFDVPRLGRVNQGGNQGDRFPVVWTGGPQTSDPVSKATGPGSDSE